MVLKLIMESFQAPDELHKDIVQIKKVPLDSFTSVLLKLVFRNRLANTCELRASSLRSRLTLDTRFSF